MTNDTALKSGRPSNKKSTATLNDLTGLKDPVRVNFDLERSERAKLKVHAARQDTTVGALLRAYVQSLPND